MVITKADKEFFQSKYDMLSKEQRKMILDNPIEVQVGLFRVVTPEHTIEQIEQILFGLEEKIDVSKYSNPKLTVEQMKKKRIEILIKKGVKCYLPSSPQNYLKSKKSQNSRKAMV